MGCSPTSRRALRAELRAQISAALGCAVASVRRLTGGNICDAWRVTLSDGADVFVKTRPGAPPKMFAAEAAGLRWLADRGPLPTPAVLAVSASFLALEYVPPGGQPVDAEALGVGLAALHRNAQPAFGLDRPNFLGHLPLQNAPSHDLIAFYRDQRLRPLIARAEPPPGMRRRLSLLLAQLEARVGPPEPPAPLHGDLWSGNLLVGAGGQPWLIDPAVFAGHRELDLAMMRLFGGFPSRAFEAYGAAYPLAPGWEDRLPLWQLYYLLAHVCLHGGGWWPSVSEALDALGIR